MEAVSSAHKTAAERIKKQKARAKGDREMKSTC